MLCNAFFFLQFIVFKFSNNDGDSDSDEILYDVGLSKWIKYCDEKMKGIIKWPPKTVDAGLLARKDKDYENDWKEFSIRIKGYYGGFHFF